ncbi:MAG: prephenate dehydrogenase/arogenate dehydrogenase family protein [Microthrixaceae bacterium]
MSGPNGSGPLAQIVGCGLVGGSVAAALRAAGWTVSVDDADPDRARRAVDRGFADNVGVDESASLCVVAVPVGSVVEVASSMLDRAGWAVTDVGSVKRSIVESLDHPRFVGGHPMAGSEQDGLDGAVATMFDGAAWVLTPTAGTDGEALALVHGAVVATGADVVTLDAAEHDRIVAMVSHVPHLTAVTLMGQAALRATADAHEPLLRLAAGGFRDMTRIAAGHPGIWPDICAENRVAVVEVLDEFLAELAEVRRIVVDEDREALLDRLERARQARLNLPRTVARPDQLAELRVTVSDRPGELATVTSLATAAGVNIYDIEIAHSAEGPHGVVIAMVDAHLADAYAAVLREQGYTCSVRRLT